MSLPTISVIIPVLNSAGDLKQCLSALQWSSYAPLEVIVIDDGSTDDSVKVASAAGAAVIELPDTAGPSRARNRGAARATGDLLVFIDADVCVHQDTLARIAERFDAEPHWSALFGSYDDDPGDPGFLSQYRNLMHAYVHQTSRREASTFWCGCGAIKRHVFLDSGGFDEGVRLASIEDVMYGRALKAAGHRILLDRDIRVKHLKNWGFRKMVVTDVKHRGIPWTHMILESQELPNELNVDWAGRISLLLTWLHALAIILGTAMMGAPFLLPLLTLAFLMFGPYWLRKTSSLKGVSITAAIAAGLLVSMWSIDQLLPIGPLVVGYLAYLVAGSRWARLVAGLSVCGAWLALIFEWSRIGGEPWMVGCIIAVTGVIWLNRGIYRYFRRVRGPLFALGAVPFRLLYHFLNGISLIVGILTFRLRQPPASQQATSVGRSSQ